LLDEQNRHLETVVFSGDIVRKDEDGFLYYVGRTDHMIKTKGYRVSPTEVEELLKNMDGISECVAVGYDVDDGINLRVFVQVSGAGLQPEDVKQYARQEFPFYLVPDDIVVLDHFPLTPNGKVDRGRIIKEHSEEKGKHDE
jgi:acyl-coenzyme A synthetase/AMP-(fatty) acid ligase